MEDNNFIAWHPQKGILRCSDGEGVFMDRDGMIQFAFCHSETLADEFGIRFQLDWDKTAAIKMCEQKLNEKGWLIRPIEIVFKDKTQRGENE